MPKFQTQQSDDPIPGKPIMVIVDTKDEHGLDKALKKFQKKIREKKVMQDVKKFEYYEKPSVGKNRKKSFNK